MEKQAANAQVLRIAHCTFLLRPAQQGEGETSERLATPKLA